MNGITNIISLPDSGPWPTRDPFLFCVHHNDVYPSSKGDLAPDSSLIGRELGQDFSNKDGWSMYHGKTVPGFPKHPHRGFETLTIIEKGIIDHSDSLGASARFGDGDAQWLTAGDGINHSEMFPLFNTKEDNVNDFFQIWINLPSDKKRVPPHFSMFWKKYIPVVCDKDLNGVETKVKLISGNYNGFDGPNPPPNSWASNKNNNVCVWIIKIDSNGEWKLPETNSLALRSLYVLKHNNITINDSNISPNSRVDLAPNVNIKITNNGIRTKLLLLQGVPIKEPIVQYGPFVMNTREEIQQAFDDYKKTDFGGWEWLNSAPTHGLVKNRFAKLINGDTDNPDS